MNNYEVKIILCTFNGQKFIEEQLYSIFNQSYKNFSIDIYDDFSKDNTVPIIKTILKKHPKINARLLIRKKNIGYYKNFMKALIDTQLNNELVLLCDQDDIWLPNKIQKVIDKYQKSDLPFFYFSRRYIVDENLNFKKIIPSKIDYPITFFHLFFQNIAGGNTIAINHILLKKIKNFRYLLVHTIHDWEIFSIALTAKDCIIFFDETPAILYRQHSAAAIGLNDDYKDFFKKIYSTLSLKYKKAINMRLNFFILNSEHLGPDQLKFIKHIKNYRNKSFFHRLINIRHISFCKYRYDFPKRMVWYIFILLGLF